jgi:arylsulfatase
MHDLAAKRPELVKQMDAAWLAWWKETTGSEWTGRNTKERDFEP